jgi:hypothetical protein
MRWNTLIGNIPKGFNINNHPDESGWQADQLKVTPAAVGVE